MNEIINQITKYTQNEISKFIIIIIINEYFCCCCCFYQQQQKTKKYNLLNEKISIYVFSNLIFMTLFSFKFQLFQFK
jgi:hypothetical protein